MAKEAGPTKTVLIIGGGVAALSAAAALVESNQCGNPVRFHVHLLTQAHRWGGRASSWHGGQRGHHDFRYWPPDCTLNHGFHAVFDESTYANFWPTFAKPYLPGLKADGYRNAYGHRNSPELEAAYHALRTRLRSNLNEFLVVDGRGPGMEELMRMTNTGELLDDINSAWQLWWYGGWTRAEVVSFYEVILGELRRYRTFDQLQEVDRYADEEFGEWCLKKGLLPSVLDKHLVKFLCDGTYVSPHKIDAASAIRGLWTFARDYEASEWFYIDGGITPQLMDPLAGYVRAQGVSWTMLMKLKRLILDPARPHVRGYEAVQMSGHPDKSSDETLEEVERADHPVTGEDTQDMDLHGHPHQADALMPCCTAPPGQVDYYICTLPLDSLWTVLQASDMADEFENVRTLATDKTRFPGPVATLNLQAWFQHKVLPDSADNVIAGLEPLCVMIDYKGLLSSYQDDERWPGSVIEINGAEEELAKASPEWVALKQELNGQVEPHDPRVIAFAKRIMKQMAERYRFRNLAQAVDQDDFLIRHDGWEQRERWNQTNKIPPFLWINRHEHNGFFVTSPGSLQHRPGITTPYDNLFLAGDWTRNRFDVPCMESAARSGRMAAVEILKKEGCGGVMVYDPD